MKKCKECGEEVVIIFSIEGSDSYFVNDNGTIDWCSGEIDADSTYEECVCNCKDCPYIYSETTETVIEKGNKKNENIIHHNQPKKSSSI